MFPKVQIFTEYPSPILSLGSSGMGKSVNTRWIEEFFYKLRHHKVIDIYDEGRFENCFIVFANENESMYADVPDFKPSGYPTECFIPVCPNLPGKLPGIFKPFRIAFNSLRKQEFMILLGYLSISQREVLNLAWKQKKKKDSFLDFINILKGIITDSKVKIEDKILEVCDDKSGLSLLIKMDNLYQFGILGDVDDPFNLDLNKIMRDQKTITCFSFAFLEDRNIRHLLWAFLFREIYRLRKKQQYFSYPDLILAHREIQKNAPARGKKSSVAYEGQTLALEHLKTIVEEPREIGIRLVGDTQFPMKIDSDVRKGFSTYFLFQMDRGIVDQLSFYLDFKTMIGVQKQGIGDCAVKTKPQRSNPYNQLGIQYPCRFPPPTSWCKKPKDLFFKIWKEHGLPFKTWRFPRIKTVVEIKRLSKKEKKAVTMRSESIYETYLKSICYILEDNPGMLQKELFKHSLISSFPHSSIIGTLTKFANSDPPLIIRKKEGRSWRLFLPSQVK